MAQDKADRPPDPRTAPPPPAERDKPSWRVSPAPDGRGAPPSKPPMLPWGPRRFLGILLVLLAVNWAVAAIVAPQKKRIRVPYTPVFLDQVRQGNVSEISSAGDTVEGDFRRDVKYKKDKAKRFKTEVPTFANDRQLSQLLQEKHVTVNAKAPGDRSLIETLLISFGPTLLLVALFVFVARRAAAGGAGGMLGGFGRSRARRVEASEQTVTFEDVAGIDEAAEELVEVVDFLRNPDRYRKLGARIPRGVLL